MKTLLLIDANSLVHRSFHALPPLTSPHGGGPTGALYGISSILLKLWREERPDYAAALFDRPEPTFRKEKYLEYKAQRPAAPSELISQIIEAHNIFPAFGIKTFEKPGFEADDLIATLAEKFKRENDLQIVILTGDRDTLQLVVGDKVVVRTFKTGVSETVTYDEKAVVGKYGLEPRQLVDYKALIGDPSDNIKGVPGIGPKTAEEILRRFDTLENAYKNLASDQKLEKRLGPFQKEAELSKDLVTLERSVPVDIGSLEELKIGENSEIGEKTKAYFRKLGFETLIKRLDAPAAESAAQVKKEKSKGVQGRMF